MFEIITPKNACKLWNNIAAGEPFQAMPTNEQEGIMLYKDTLASSLIDALDMPRNLTIPHFRNASQVVPGTYDCTKVAGFLRHWADQIEKAAEKEQED